MGFDARGAWPSSMLIKDTEFTNLHMIERTNGGSGAVVDAQASLLRNVIPNVNVADCAHSFRLTQSSLR